MKVDDSCEIKITPALEGMVALQIKTGKAEAWRSIFLTQATVNELILQLSHAKKANDAR